MSQGIDDDDGSSLSPWAGAEPSHPLGGTSADQINVLDDYFSWNSFLYPDYSFLWSSSPTEVGPDILPEFVGSRTDDFYWQYQSEDFDCAVVAQLCIIHEYNPQERISEADLVYEATATHMLTSEGMDPDDVGRLLQMHGIDNHTVHQADICDIMSELSAGHKVIVGVYGEELWDEYNPLYAFTKQAADHAIWVTGVDATDPNHVQVIINDSGSIDGRGATYDLNTFLDAWSASGYTYVATDHPPEGLAACCPDFDADSGTFSTLLGSIRGRHPQFDAAGVFDHPSPAHHSIGPACTMPPTIVHLTPEQRVQFFKNI